MHIDNYIIFAKNYKKIQEIIKSLESNFKLIDEGDFSAYLGINIIRNKNQTWTLLQLFLIDRILKALNLQEDSMVHDTPATEILASNKNREACNES